MDFATEAHILYQEAKVLELSVSGESIQALTKLVQRFPQSDYRVGGLVPNRGQAFTQGQYRAAEHAFTQIIETLASQTVPGQEYPITPPPRKAGLSPTGLLRHGRLEWFQNSVSTRVLSSAFLDYWDLVWTIREPVFAKGLVTQSQDV